MISAAVLDVAASVAETRVIGASIVRTWNTSAAPPPALTVSQWADANRFLPETSASRGAPWRTATTPYLRGIMDAVHEPGVKKIALKKGHQIGGSEALHNILGYFIEHDPCPMLLVQPTAGVAEEWSKERLSDMLRSTPALGDVIRTKRAPRGSNEPESTLDLKLFPGGFLAMGGANTPNTFARRAVRIAAGDDVDRWPAVVGEEGDPADLLGDRTTTFNDGLVIFVSTPTLKYGRIDTLYTQSDQRKYFVACPCCGREDWITWNDETHFRVAFDGHDAETARLECPPANHGGCGLPLLEPERRQMIAGGEWRPTATPKELGLVGFHLPSLLSTLGSVSLPWLVEKWLSARQKGKESLRVFINTSLAEGWEDRGARMEPNTLYARREPYGQDIEIPAAGACLTAGVDVQVDRFELQVMAWGLSSERWVVDYRVIPGDPRHAETQEKLLEALGRRYAHALGPQIPIHVTCVDTGNWADEMYDFVLRYQVRRIYATKGFGGKSGEPIVGKPSEKRPGRKPRPVRLYPINVDDAKAELYGSLALVDPGPGFVHFPLELDTINEEYFAQLCAEHRETKYNKAGVATHTVWVEDRERNEALDTAVLCMAAFRLLNPNIRQMHAAIVAAGATPVATPAPAAKASSGPGQDVRAKIRARRAARSSYLNRR